jgi:hypothetical protein
MEAASFAGFGFIVKENVLSVFREFDIPEKGSSNKAVHISEFPFSIRVQIGLAFPACAAMSI